nr:DUF2514 family protein [Kosakonia sacchari]
MAVGAYYIRVTSIAAGAKQEEMQWRAKWLARDVADAGAQLEQERQNRQAEQDKQSTMDKITNEAETEKQKARANVVAANAIADKLRGELDTIRREYATSGASEVAGVNTRGKTAAETIILLTKLYRESDARAGKLAQYADDAARAGATCERAYDAMRNPIVK